MNTTKLPINIYDLTAFQLLRFVSSSDTDASEFGTRFVLYLSLVAKNNRSQEEQQYLGTLLGALTSDYVRPEFRQHLAEVLRGLELAQPPRKIRAITE